MYNIYIYIFEVCMYDSVYLYFEVYVYCKYYLKVVFYSLFSNKKKTAWHRWLAGTVVWNISGSSISIVAVEIWRAGGAQQ